MTALLYEKLADDLAVAIRRGSLRSGDRMPSVRGLARQRSVSVATVIEAYSRLENDGLVEVRERSGHFVRRREERPLDEPSPPRRSMAPQRVSVSSGVRAVMESMRDSSVVPLGAAQVSPELLPIRELNLCLAGIAKEVQHAGASYGGIAGVPTLRRQLSKRSVRWGLSLHESEFVVTVGAMEALNLCLRAVAKPNDAIAVETPTYFGLLQAIEQLGLKAIEVPSHPRTGLDLAALEQVLRSTGARAVLASPNVSNPMGSTMSDEAKEKLVGLCRKFDVPLIEDDVYGDLGFEGRPRPALAWDTDGRVMLVGSVSKTLAPGYRIGWVVPGRYAERVEALKFSLTVSTPALLQMAVAEFLASSGYERHLRRLRSRLERHVELGREAIARSFPEGTRVSSPSGGFVLWVELPAGVDAMQLHAAALKERIAIAPGPIFTASGRFTSHIRISCGFPWSKRIEDAVATVGRLAEEQLIARRG